MLTPTQRAQLATELADDPAGIGYAAMLPAAPGHVVAALNASSTSMVKSFTATARTLLSTLDPTVAATFLETLEAVAVSGSPVAPVVKWGLKFVTSDGIDLGHPATRGLIDALVNGAILDQSIGDAVKALAVQPASRAEALFGAGALVDLRDVLVATGVES